MGLRFQKRVTILPGVRLNVSKSGFSWTLGPRGASVSVGKRGVYSNIGLPGTGLSYRNRIAPGHSPSAVTPFRSDPSDHLTSIPGWLAFLAVCFALGSVIAISLQSYIWSAVLVLGIIGTLFLRAKWVQAEREYVVEKAAERENQLAEQRRARIEYLMSRHGRDADLVARIHAGELWIGQTADQLRDSYGEPEDIDEKVMKTRRREIWKYDQIGANRFSTKITLDNGVVVSWDKRD